MNCREFEEIAVEMARGRIESADALAHADGCARCAARLEEERWLTGALGALDRDTAPQEAPARVEEALIEAFRARARRARWAWAGMAAAAAVVAAMFLANRPGPVPPPPPPALLRAGLPPAPAVVAPAPRRIRPRPARVRPTTPAAEIATEFIPLPYGSAPAPLESARMFRLRLPRTALLGVGLPVNMDRADDSVKADVVFGEDGMARAIRFVK